MQKLYYNGVIRTMRANEVAEAVLTQDGRICAVGEYRSLLRRAPTATPVDLCGHTMLPAFIDAHSHLSSYAMSFLQVPLDECSNFEEIQARIESFIAQNHVLPGVWVTAKGYDHNALAEKTHPSLAMLDAAAPQNPLLLQHASGHVGVLNTRALQALGITAETPAPDGGRIGIKDGKLTGYLEESAFIEAQKQVPMPGMKEMLSAYQKAQESYAAHGITTIQEGMVVAQMLPLYQFLMQQNLLYLDVVAYPMASDVLAFCTAFPATTHGYREHVRFGGIKIVLDGSPQGRTAWMRTPYQDETPPYYGYAAMTDEAVTDAVRLAADKNLQILAHCNGDAAAAQYIRAVDTVSRETGKPLSRPVMVHAQLLGPDQLADVKRLGIIPSFFVAHVYHWGDVHIRNFGLARAAQISPTRSALAHNISFTFHQDTPVIAPDMLETIWCAVNRITKAGVQLGKNECISVHEALKAVTVNAAYQYGEEAEKGSIEIGKVADFVILDKDPCAVPPMEIKDIVVLQTIKADAVLYSRAKEEV